MRVRKARISDIRKIEMMAEDKGIEYFERIIKKETCYVAEEGDIIGIIYGEKNEREKWTDLRGIMVKKEWRGKGVGTKLIKKFMKYAVGEIEVYYQKEARILLKLGFKKYGSYNLYLK